MLQEGLTIDTDSMIQMKQNADGSSSPQLQTVSRYFAAAHTEDIAKELQKKVDYYYNYIVSAQLSELWRRSYRAYYGMRQRDGGSGWGVFDVGGLISTGDQGEIVRIKVNQYANYITHQMALAVGQRPAMECRAVNSDASSLISAQLGNGVLEYFMRERKIENNYYQAVETGILMSEGYTALGWEAKAGKPYGKGPNGAVLYDGDLKATNFTPFQVIKDTTKNSDSEQLWYITHSKRNRYDLMADYPNLADQLSNVSSDATTSVNRTYSDPSKIIAATSFGVTDTDDIPYYEFYHAKTSAMPTGRYTIFVNGDIKLFDGPLPFREIPIYRIAPKNIIGTPFGWTPAFDALAIQELIDKLYSAVATNNLGSAIANFWMPPGNGVAVSQLAGGRNLIESVTRPEILQLLNTPAEVYNFINKLENIMGIIFGVSDVNRGDLPSKDLSGSALAFMASQAITFNSQLSASTNQFLESLGLGMMHILTDYAATPRIATISGIQNRPLMKTYQGNDLTGINNVVVDETSALSKTTAGKISIADNLLQAGQISDPQEYMTLIKTGNIEPLTRRPLMENFLIQQENEYLLQGKPVQVIRIDKHAQHIDEHSSLLASPDARQDGNLVKAVLDHIAEHEYWQNILQQNEPEYLAATGQKMLPYPTPPPPPQPPTANAPAPGGGPGATAGIAGTVNGQGPVAQQAANVKMPGLPKLPKGTDPQTQSSYTKLASN